MGTLTSGIVRPLAYENPTLARSPRGYFAPVALGRVPRVRSRASFAPRFVWPSIGRAPLLEVRAAVGLCANIKRVRPTSSLESLLGWPPHSLRVDDRDPRGGYEVLRSAPVTVRIATPAACAPTMTYAHKGNVSTLNSGSRAGRVGGTRRMNLRMRVLDEREMHQNERRVDCDERSSGEATDPPSPQEHGREGGRSDEEWPVDPTNR